MKGTKFGVYYVQDQNSERRAETFLASLKSNESAKFLRIMKKLADGHSMKREEYDSFPNERLWELKIWGQRLIGFYGPGGRAYLTHGFGKRGDRATRSAEIEPGVRIRDHFNATQSP